MMETMKKIFDFKKVLKNKTSIIIDAFNAFYKEENISLIEDKLNNLSISIKMKDNTIKEIILESKIEELITYIKNNIESKELKVKINKEYIKKCFENNRFRIKEYEDLKYSYDLSDKELSLEYQNIKKEFNHIKDNYKELNELLRIYEYAKQQLNLKYRTEYQNKVKDLLLNHTKIPVNSIINNLDLFVEKDFNDVPLVHLIHESDDNKIMSIFVWWKNR